MHRRGVFILPLMLALGGSLRANLANGDPPEWWTSRFSRQQHGAMNIENTFSFPKADEMRMEIASLIVAGRTDDEIKKSLVEQYSLRIFALPEGVRGEWLSWTPIAALAAGLFILTGFLHRSMHRLQDAVVSNGAPMPSDPSSEEEAWH